MKVSRIEAELKDIPIFKRMDVVNNWIHDPKHRAVYEEKLRENTTNEKLAEKYDYSTNQISNILKECKDAVLAHVDELPEMPAKFVIGLTPDYTFKLLSVEYNSTHTELI